MLNKNHIWTSLNCNVARWVFSNTKHAVQIETKLSWAVDSGISDLKRRNHEIKILHLKNILKSYFFPPPAIITAQAGENNTETSFACGQWITFKESVSFYAQNFDSIIDDNLLPLKFYKDSILTHKICDFLCPRKSQNSSVLVFCFFWNYCSIWLLDFTSIMKQILNKNNNIDRVFPCTLCLNKICTINSVISKAWPGRSQIHSYFSVWDCLTPPLPLKG